VCSLYHQVCSLVSLCSVKFLENNFLLLWNSFSSLVCTFLHCTLREWILWYYWCWVCDETKREGTPGSIKAPAAAHSPRPHSPLQKKASKAGPPAMAMGFFLLKLWHLDQQGSPHASCKSHCTCGPTNRGLSDDHAFKQGTVRAQLSGFLEEGEDDYCDPNSIACLTSKQDLSAIILGLLLLLGILCFCVDARCLLALEFNYLCFLTLVFISGGIFSKWCENKIVCNLWKKV
jgi:hypothetical protein